MRRTLWNGTLLALGVTTLLSSSMTADACGRWRHRRSCYTVCPSYGCCEHERLLEWMVCDTVNNVWVQATPNTPNATYQDSNLIGSPCVHRPRPNVPGGNPPIARVPFHEHNPWEVGVEGFWIIPDPQLPKILGLQIVVVEAGSPATNLTSLDGTITGHSLQKDDVITSVDNQSVTSEPEWKAAVDNKQEHTITVYTPSTGRISVWKAKFRHS